MREMKILSINDVILLVKLIIGNFNIQLPLDSWSIVENDIKDYALQIYSGKIKEDSLSTNVMV